MSEIFKKKFGLFFHFFFFFLLSHPLYFSYFIFLFPYFLNLLSFLSPLFFSTFLLCFVFSSLFLSSSSDLHSVPQFSDDSKMGFLASILQVVFDSLRPRTRDEIDEIRSVEELEAYKMVFESCNFGSEQDPYGGEDSEFIIPEVEVNVDCEESMENFPGKILEVKVDCEESVEKFPGKILDVDVDCKESVEYFPGKILDMEVDSKESMEIFPEKILDMGVDSKESMENFPEKVLETKVDCEESVEYFVGKILDMGVYSEDSMENFPGKILDIEVDSKESMENYSEKILESKVACEESVENFPGKILDVAIDFEESMNVEIDYEEHLKNPSLNENVAEIEAKTEQHEEAKTEKKEEIRDSWNATENKINKDTKKIREESWMNPRNSLRSYGSMRKEKEWGRTPASKLFEDRHDSEETEGMDLLWETYEKMESKKLQKINGRSKRGKRIEDEDEDEDEDENGNGYGEGKLCCLQALKLSARKMNLGMGKTNLVKMSKALKGFGLFRKRSFIR